MPSYTLKDTKENITWDIICSYSELQDTLDNMDNIIQVPSAPQIVSGVGNLHSKVPDGFKDVLSRVKTGSAGYNTIKK
jgi:hypothetical protein